MFAEVGLLLLLLGTVAAAIRGAIPLLFSQLSPLRHYCRSLSQLCSTALVLSVISLAICFVSDDFSVRYVADHSNSQLAFYYKAAAVWGSHEGSLLFWLMAMTVCMTRIHKQNQFGFDSATVMAWISTAFGAFLIFTSNPFARILPDVPIEGRDLNPMLQNIGLIVHPPMVFLGYVAVSVLFAGAMAILYRGELNQLRQQWLRRWTLISWVLLTGGNVLGAWWAYSQLGWGGWWFWDPVENSSFIPWLVTTALLHSLYLNQEKQLRLTTLLLCISAFSLSLLGTFLVRSGVIQSVHAFASDPSRGYSILVILALVAVGGFTLFARNASRFEFKQLPPLNGRQGLLALGVVLILVATVAVVLGTIYPVIFQALDLGAISVGPPYFNSIFVPLTIASASLLTLLLSNNTPLRVLLWALAIVFASLCNWAWAEQPYWLLWLGAFGGSLLLTSCIVAALQQRQSLPATLAHTGLAIAILSATAVSNFEQQAMVQMGPGEGRFVGNIAFVFESSETVSGRGYQAQQATIRLEDSDGNELSYLYPQRKHFGATNMQLTVAAVEHGIIEDRYISMGPTLQSGKHLIRISRKPLINGLWFAGIMMIGAGFIALWQQRRRRQCA